MRKPPKEGTKAYKSIVKEGCHVYRDSYTGEFECANEYGWECDNCPVAIESNKLEEENK